MFAQPHKLHPSHRWKSTPPWTGGARCEKCGCKAYLAAGFPTLEAANECKERLSYDALMGAGAKPARSKRPRPTIATHGFEVRRKPRALPTVIDGEAVRKPRAL